MKKRKRILQRMFASVLTAAMVGTMIPAAAFAAQQTINTPLLADFTFDDEASVLAGGNAKATVNGSYELKDSKDAASKKALYLDGNASNYLSITDKDGNSLLAGKTEITVSYDVKPDRTATSWVFYAAPNTDAQKSPEYYIGAFVNNGNTKVERYKNGRTVSFETKTGTAWSHVDIVYSEKATTAYVNGTKVQSVENSNAPLPDILGDSGILYIGRANWGSGEGYKGWIDNFKIYDGALTDDDLVVKLSDEEVLAAAVEKLDIPGKDNVKGNVTLLKELKIDGAEGKATVSWKSSDTSVVTDADKDGKAAGVVTRKANDTKVTMTATVKYGSLSETKAIVLNVKAAPKNLDTDYTAGYLWTNFDASGGYEKIFFGYSEDGLKWGKLNKDAGGTPQPVLVNNAEGSDLGVRDPHIIRSAEGDKYWILGTDLHAEGGGAGGSGWNQLSASQNLVVWESDDLVTWSEPKLVYAGFDNAGCVWAPEAIYDETTGDYLVYWSARDKSKANTSENALRVYVCRTRDFVNFTEPKVWLSEDTDAKEINIIDSTIVYDGENYYRFSTSDWNTVIDVSKTLSEDTLDVKVSEDKSANGDWTRLVKRAGSGSAGFDGREGFTVYQLPDGKWCAMGDNGGYKAFLTDDLSTGKFTAANAEFTDGRFRHGTVMRLSAAEQERLLEAYGEGKTPDDPDEPIDKKVLAQFDFDDETGGFTSENAKAAGSHTLTDSWNAENGKALYLDGSSSNFLTVTDKKGGSLLAGATELTVSFEMKNDRTSTNWPFYAAPNDNKQDYLKSEHYIGFLMKDGSLTVERYNQNGSRPANPSASVGNKWTRVDVVMTASKTSIYINGALKSEVGSSHKIPDILGNSSILQIGKANWGDNGEYFKGWIDNMTIRNYALTAEEVKEVSAEFANTLPMIDAAVVGTAPTKEEAENYRGTDDHTAIITKVDEEKKILTPYVRKAADVTKLPVTVNLNVEAELTAGGKAFTNGSELDLSKDVKLVAKNSEGREEIWTIKAAVRANNPVLPGQYADPDIDYFDGKFWIFPTTDGYSGWSGTIFHAFSSEDMVNWTDEGVILDLANDNPGKNEKGVQIAASKWASGNAWAPTIEEKDGKYYFYYCGRTANDGQAIGVAVADNPAGPYTDKGEPLVTTSMCRNAGVNMGQAIDPSIFTDDDGRSYVMFGNGAAAMAELNDDMMSIKEGTFRQLNGLRDFRESPVVIKVGDKYHWTWSCDDTGSPNYHVNYGVSDTLDGNVTYVKTLLQKDESQGMLGTAHQSVLKITDVYGKERYFIAYHRFYTPLNIYTSGLGYHRETCIDEITFGEDGYMQAVPTLEGVGKVRMSIDKSELQEEVDNAAKNPEKYTEDSWKAYEEALNAAKKVLADEKAAQEEIDAAVKTLAAAKAALEEKPTKLPYVDVEKEAWYYDAVAYNYYAKTMTGLDPTHFGPSNTLVRAQFAAVLHKMNGEPKMSYKVVFSDVTAGDWFKDAVLWASDAKIVTGYTGTDLFGANDPVTRSQMATMMYRYAKEYKKYDVGADGDYSNFPDAGEVQEFAVDALKWAVAEGIITGKTINGQLLLDPQGSANRAECATIIQRFMEKYEK